MDEETYSAFKLEKVEIEDPVVTVYDISGADRTLTLGYDCDRNTFHVWVEEGCIHAMLYSGHDTVDRLRAKVVLWRDYGLGLPARILRPNKRVHPQYTDVTFARTMRDLGFQLPFTNWSEPAREGPFYGALR